MGSTKIWPKFDFRVYFLRQKSSEYFLISFSLKSINLGTQFSKFNNCLWVCWFLGKNISNFVPLIWKLHNPYCHNLHNHIQLLLRGVDAHIGRDKKREFLMTPIVKISNLGHYKKFMETIIQRTFHCYTTHYQFHPCSSARAAALYVCAW